MVRMGQPCQPYKAHQNGKNACTLLNAVALYKPYCYSTSATGTFCEILSTLTPCTQNAGNLRSERNPCTVLNAHFKCKNQTPDKQPHKLLRATTKSSLNNFYNPKLTMLILNCSPTARYSRHVLNLYTMKAKQRCFFILFYYGPKIEPKKWQTAFID